MGFGIQFDHAVKDLQEKFGNLRPAQIPSPYQSLSGNLDPIILKEMNKLVLDAVMVAWDLLNKSQIPKTVTPEEKELKEREQLRVASTLSRPRHWPHSHIIDVDEGAIVGLNIASDAEKTTLLKTYKKWVAQRLKEPEASHIIEYFTPKLEQQAAVTPVEAA